MNGVSSQTGRPIDDDEHLRQSIADILTTPIGSRVMRRDYGSLLPELVDQPFNALTRLRMFAASGQALTRWEPRLQVTKLAIGAGEDPGSLVIDVYGFRTDLPERSEYTRFTLPIRAGYGRAQPSAA